MLNQEKIGKFIAERRKNKNMTQKQMAEELGVSDKAVSKWETGKSMPDNSLLMELCTLLEINVNELLSGEKLSDYNYQGKAEENMTNLMEEREYEKRQQKRLVWETIIGALGFIVAMVLAVFISAGNVAWYIDIPSAFMLLSVVVFVVFVSGYGIDFFRTFAICFGKRDTEMSEIERSIKACNIVLISVFITGIMMTLIGVISILHQANEEMNLVVNMAIAVIPMLYTCIIDLLILPFEARLWLISKK